MLGRIGTRAKTWWMARSRRTQVLLVIAAAVLLIGRFTSGPGREPAAQTIAAPTAAAARLTPAGQAISSPTAAPAAEFIAGLTVADIKLNLEKRGLRCEGPRALVTLQSWTCKGNQGSDVEFMVDVLGIDATRVRSVDANVLQYQAQPTDAIAAEFLGFIATLPYDKSDPTQAREWVRANIARSGSNLVIASARFELTRAETGRAHSLDIVAVGAR